MRPTALRLLVISNLLLLSMMARAADRPRYGGVLRIEMSESWADNANPLRSLVFENLTRVDDSGRPQPQLATSWESQNDGRRWQFWLRRDVHFHDAAPLTAAAIVASLTAGKCEACTWTGVRAVGDSVVFEFADARPLFATELALPRYAIQRAGEIASGTGPFRLTARRGTSVVLVAFDDYWDGRPFVDSIEITDGRAPHDQAADFDLGRADVVEVGPEHLRRLQQQNARTWSSQPVGLIALRFGDRNPALGDVRLRQAIALTVDRTAIHNVVLQKQGEIAGGLLPNWISGYAFLLQQTRDVPRAQQLRAEIGNVPPLKIAAEGGDPTLQLIADRMALNARDAGLIMQASPRDVADLYVTRQTVKSIAPAVAFEAAVESITATAVAPPDPIQRLYEAERNLAAQGAFVPLVYVPRTYAISQRVRNWAATPDGHLNLEQVWIDAATAAGAKP